MNSRSKVTSKGQVTIPANIRNTLNIEEGDQLVFERAGEYEVKVRVIKAKPLSSLLGALRAKTDPMEMKYIKKQAYDEMVNKKYNARED